MWTSFFCRRWAKGIVCTEASIEDWDGWIHFDCSAAAKLAATLTELLTRFKSPSNNRQCRECESQTTLQFRATSPTAGSSKITTGCGKNIFPGTLNNVHRILVTDTGVVAERRTVHEEPVSGQHPDEHQHDGEGEGQELGQSETPTAAKRDPAVRQIGDALNQNLVCVAQN